jgi:hypothetical protein
MGLTDLGENTLRVSQIQMALTWLGKTHVLTGWVVFTPLESPDTQPWLSLGYASVAGSLSGIAMKHLLAGPA